MSLTTIEIPHVRDQMTQLVNFMREGVYKHDDITVVVTGNTSPSFPSQSVLKLEWPKSSVRVCHSEAVVEVNSIVVLNRFANKVFSTGVIELFSVAFMTFRCLISGDRRPTIEWGGDHIRVFWKNANVSITAPGPNPTIELVKIFADHADVVTEGIYPDWKLVFV